MTKNLLIILILALGFSNSGFANGGETKSKGECSVGDEFKFGNCITDVQLNGRGYATLHKRLLEAIVMIEDQHKKLRELKVNLVASGNLIKVYASDAKNEDMGDLGHRAGKARLDKERKNWQHHWLIYRSEDTNLFHASNIQNFETERNDLKDKTVQ